MKIGIDFSVQKFSGGAYQYCLAFLDVLKRDKNNRYVIFNYSPDLPSEYADDFEILNLSREDKVDGVEKNGLRVKIRRLFFRTLLYVRLFFITDFLLKKKFADKLKAIETEKIDLMLFPSGAQYAPFVKIPYISVVYDLEHRKHPEYAEVSKGGEWLKRDHYYKKLCQTAVKILVDSQIGKDDVLRYYKIESDKVIILPYLPPDYLDENLSIEDARAILKEYNLPNEYFFYPAQFWSHKNHMNLVKAVKILKDKDKEVNLILIGSKKEEWGEFDRVFDYVKANGLENNVIYPGYVKNEAVGALYKTAIALVMPTFFGPTNIPVLEAWKMSCPVLYSNISGCREQLGEAGLLIDPASPEDIAAKMEKIMSEEGLRKELAQKGKQRLSLWGYKDFSEKVNTIIWNLKK